MTLLHSFFPFINEEYHHEAGMRFQEDFHLGLFWLVCFIFAERCCIGNMALSGFSPGEVEDRRLGWKFTANWSSHTVLMELTWNIFAFCSACLARLLGSRHRRLFTGYAWAAIFLTYQDWSSQHFRFCVSCEWSPVCVPVGLITMDFGHNSFGKRSIHSS